MSQSSSSPPSLALLDSIAPSGINHSSLRQTRSGIEQRARIASQHVRYFGLVARKCSFGELLLSARRAGFALINEDAREKTADFRWTLGEPDFNYSVSFKDLDKVSFVGEAVGDILGLVLIGHSHISDVSVEIMPWLGMEELGPNAVQFREILLTLPDFIETPAWANY